MDSGLPPDHDGADPLDVDVIFGRPQSRRFTGSPNNAANGADGGRSPYAPDVDIVVGRPGSREPAHPLRPESNADWAGVNSAVRDIAGKLRVLGAEGRVAADRIQGVWKDVGSYSPAAAYGTINPDEVSEAIERTYFARAHWLTLIRNVLILLPLLLTWIALGLASYAYQQEVAHYPTDVYLPLLDLWQRGFMHQGTGTTFKLTSFTAVAFVDAGIFALLIIVGGFADSLAMRARKVAQQAKGEIEDVTLKICAFAAKFGASESGVPDMQKWSQQIMGTIRAAAAATQHASDSLDKIGSLAATFQSDVSKLTSSAATVSTSANSLSSAVGNVVTSANAMKVAADAAATQQKLSSDALNAVLGKLNELAASSAGSASEVRKMSSEILSGFRESSGAMRDAAATMQNAAERLGGRLPIKKPGWFRRHFGGSGRSERQQAARSTDYYQAWNPGPSSASRTGGSYAAGGSPYPVHADRYPPDSGASAQPSAGPLAGIELPAVRTPQPPAGRTPAPEEARRLNEPFKRD